MNLSSKGGRGWGGGGRSRGKEGQEGGGDSWGGGNNKSLLSYCSGSAGISDWLADGSL